MEWYGHRGRVLEIDLSSRKHRVRYLTEEEARDFVGGSGLNAKLLYDMVSPGTKPLSPENPLIFGAGPLVGTMFPASARATFTSLSPLTDIFGDTNGGGYFGARVKQSGYDHLIITGTADSPCYLVLLPGGDCAIEDATEIWGKDTLATEEILKKKYPGSAVACIGPAGENLCNFANIMSHRNSCSYSRTGMGTVMGSKKLKAIVATGKGKVPVKDPDALKAITDRVNKWTEESPAAQVFSQISTQVMINIYTALGFAYGYGERKKLGPEDGASVDASKFAAATEIEHRGCWMCPLKCIQHYRIKDGPYRGEEGYKYEVGYAYPFGFTLGIRDVASILHLVNCCNRLGIDAHEFVATAALAIESYQKGILDGPAVDGMDLDWGNTDQVENLSQKIAHSEGIGEILAQGMKKAAEEIGGGIEKYAVHMKGLSHAVMSSPAFTCSYAVSTRGGDHLKGMPMLCFNAQDKELAERLFQATDKTVDVFSHEDKGRAIWWHENYKMIIDSLGTCFFLSQTLLPYGLLLPEHLAEGYRAATGFDASGDDLFLAGERCYQVEKAFNARLGISRKDDYFTTRPEPDSAGHDVDLDHPGMLDEYYQYRGCSRDGIPTRERLEDVGLGDIADELEEVIKKREKVQASAPGGGRE